MSASCAMWYAHVCLMHPMKRHHFSYEIYWKLKSIENYRECFGRRVNDESLIFSLSLSFPFSSRAAAHFGTYYVFVTTRIFEASMCVCVFFVCESLFLLEIVSDKWCKIAHARRNRRIEKEKIFKAKIYGKKFPIFVDCATAFSMAQA